MPYQKSEPVFRDKEKKIPEPGIWRLKNSRFYLAEVTYRDPVTDKRIRERKTVNRLDLAKEWIQTRVADALRGDITRKRKKKVKIKYLLILEKWISRFFRIVFSENCKFQKFNVLDHTFG